jgi:hypothetical protein
LSDWFTLRTQARRDIHAAFSVRAEYTDPTVVEPVPLAVNWHSRFGLPVGDLAGGDYAGVLETIDRLVFDRQQIIDNGVTLRRGGRVSLIDYGYIFTLDVREPNSGPIREIWTVAN